MMLMGSGLFTLLAILAFSLSGCGIGQVADQGGSGSETTDGTLVGRVAYADGAVPIKAGVILRPLGFLAEIPDHGDPKYIPDVLTGVDGKYQLDSLTPGRYCLEIRDGKGKSFLDTVEVLASKARIAVGTNTLIPSAILFGQVQVQSETLAPGYIRIEGLERATHVDSTGSFIFRDLPEGTHRLQIVSTTPGWGYANPSPIYIKSGDSVRLALISGIAFDTEKYSVWSASKTILINTAKMLLVDSVVDYPVLVRLNSNNFDFSKANADGSDLRFTGSDTTPLAFSIDYFDKANQSAAVWVKLPKIVAADSMQNFKIYWGNPKATTPTFTSPPFSSQNGYAAVWHMDSTFQDVSANGNHGSNGGSRSEPSLIGEGRAIQREKHDSISVPYSKSLYLNQFTVSLWVKTRSNLPSQGLLGTRFGSEHTFDLKLIPAKDLIPAYLHADIGDGKIWIDSLADVPFNFIQNEWSHIGFSVDSSGYKIYLDGQLAKSVSFVGALTPLFMDSLGSLNLGNSYSLEGSEHLDGVMDEVRISHKVRSTFWLQLDFENQREASSLLEFK